MGFFDSLAANPKGSSVYNPGGGSNYGVADALAFKKQRDQQDLENYQKKANFDSTLQLRQENLRRLYNDPNHGGPAPNAGLPNVVFKDNQPDITPLQGAQLDVQRERFADERNDRAFAQNQTQQRTNLAAGNLELEKKKNQQIFDTKQADLERKATDSANREALAREQMKGRENDMAAQRVLHQTQMDRQAAEHALELHRRDTAAEEQRRQFQDRYDQREREIAGRESSTTTTEIDPNKNSKTVTKTSGKAGSKDNPLDLDFGQ